jgi:protein TonB
MTSALANTFPLGWEPDGTAAADRSGSQTLLTPIPGKSSISLQAAAVAAYALVLVALATFTLRESEQVLEEPLELVMLPAEPEIPAVEEPPPPPIEEVLDEPPPPPIAEEPEPVAPVEQKPIIPEKKPIPVKKKVADKPPVQEQRRATTTAPGPATSAPAPANAIPSGYANQIFARVSRTASTSTARAAIARGQSGRVGYRLVIGPGGQLLSKSISASGNPTFDQAATEALGRAAPFPPTGVSRPVSLSGAIVYR